MTASRRGMSRAQPPVPDITPTSGGRRSVSGRPAWLRRLLIRTSWCVSRTPTSLAAVLNRRQCVGAGEGRAWAIARASRGRWAAVHVSSEGITVGPWEQDYPTRNERELTLFASQNDELPQALFDYDGDGVPEFLHGKLLTEPGSGGTAVIYGELWSYRAGKVVRYPGAPAGIRLARDLDGDGRPDLLFSPFRGKLSFTLCDRVFEANSSNDAALFAAHSLPDGTFSSTDQVAIAHAKTWCPEPPDLAATGDSAYLRIRCARAWGVGVHQLAPLLDAYCQQEIERCPSRQCVDRSVLWTWARLRAPLQLNH